MKKKVSYYVNSNNFFTWTSIICFLVSAGCRIYAADMLKHTQEPHLLLVTLPVAAAILFVITILLYGKDLLFRTAVPFNLGMLFFAVRLLQSSYSLKVRLAFVLVCLFIGIFYTEVLAGNSQKRLLLGLTLLSTLIVEGIFLFKRLDLAALSALQLLDLADFLLIAGAFFIICAMTPSSKEGYHPTWGDRADGRRIRTLDTVTQVANFIMRERSDASNSIHDRVELTEIREFIAKKKEEGYPNMNIMHVLMAAYVRAAAQYPGTNRFVSGQRVYSRGEDIQLCMVVKNRMTLDADESILKLHLTPRDTIYDVYRKLDAEITRIKSMPVGGSDFDKTAKLLSMTPRVFLRFAIWLLEKLDYYGLLPKALLEISPFHSSVFFTSMASLGINPIVHHLYNFGNMPVFCSFGSKYYVYELDPEGNQIRREYVDYTFNTDERIANGYYYASVFRYIKKLLKHPEKLEQPPKQVLTDID